MNGRWQEWPMNVAPVLVRDGEVLVFRAALDLEGSVVDLLRRSLSSEETGRSERFMFRSDRRRFVAAHGFLRALLGSCLDVDPSSIVFRRDRYGKPRIASPKRGAWLRFSMSVSGDTALYALARKRDVGVDLEGRSGSVIDGAIEARILPEAVRAHLAALSAERRRSAFFDCWVRHEARGKAAGWGLVEPAREIREWTVLDCPPGATFAGACAVEGSGATLVARTLMWNPRGLPAAR